jgi:uncharacterized protein YkwD
MRLTQRLGTVVTVLAVSVLLSGCVPLRMRVPGSVTATPATKPSLATDFMNRLNAERRLRNLKPLKSDPRLQAYAVAWSRTMGITNTFKHSHIGDLLGPYIYVGENIAVGGGGAASLHEAFMHSIGHRDDILSPGFTNGGVGVYCAPNGSLWVTEEFARPTSKGLPKPWPGNTPLNPLFHFPPSKHNC